MNIFCPNDLPQYFSFYQSHLEGTDTEYNLRPHPLPFCHQLHVCNPESCTLYKYVDMKTLLATSTKIDEIHWQ